MKVLVDTSVFVAASLNFHQDHTRATTFLHKIRTGNIEGFVAAHSLVETYATLTRMPIRPRITASGASHLIKRNILDVCKIVTLSQDDYLQLIEHLVSNELVGGVSYDAIIGFTAVKEAVDAIATFNTQDFQRIFPLMPFTIYNL